MSYHHHIIVLVVAIMACGGVRPISAESLVRAGASFDDLSPVILERFERWSLSTDGSRRRFVRLTGRGDPSFALDDSFRLPEWHDGRLGAPRTSSTRCRDGLVAVSVEIVEEAPASAVGAFIFSPRRLFDQAVPVKRDVFQVAVQGGGQITWVTRRMGDRGEPSVRRRDGWSRWEWSLEDPFVLSDEMLAPSSHDRAPSVRVSALKDWTSVSGWLEAMIRRNTIADPMVVETVRRARLEERDPLDLLFAVQTLVSKKVKYREETRGTGADVAGVAAGTILRRGYGDCVDRSIVATALLRHVGVESYPLFISTRGYRPFEPELPSVYVGDHCVVRAVIEGQSFVFDPGAHWYGVSLLPADASGVVGFEPETNSFYRTPDTSSSDHGLEVEQSLELGSDRVLFGRFRCEIRGEDAVRFRRTIGEWNDDEVVARGGVWLEKMVGYPTGSVSTWHLVEDDLLRGRIIVEGEWIWSHGVSVVDDLALLIVPGHLHDAYEVGNDHRMHDLAYDHPTRHRVRTRIMLPPDVRPAEEHWSRRLETPQATMKLSRTQVDGFLVVDDEYERTERRIPVEYYAEFRDVLRERAAFGRRGVLLLGWSENEKRRASGTMSADPPTGAVVNPLASCRDVIRLEVKHEGQVRGTLRREYRGPAIPSLQRALVGMGRGSLRDGYGAAVRAAASDWSFRDLEIVDATRVQGKDESLSITSYVQCFEGGSMTKDGRLVVSLPSIPSVWRRHEHGHSQRVRLIGPEGYILQGIGLGHDDGTFSRFIPLDERSIVWEEERVQSSGLSPGTVLARSRAFAVFRRQDHH